MWIEMFFIKFEGKIENVWGNHSKNKFLGWLRIQNEKVHVSKKKVQISKKTYERVLILFYKGILILILMNF